MRITKHASEIGVAQGYLPLVLNLAIDGENHRFERKESDVCSRDLAGVFYREEETGLTLLLLND